ncbi:hydrogen peroxide-inducible genes activator [Microscilla marina]|uniref:Transcriptional regulator, LysR family n=1 Tax=Microscilla marina ATCC 23134 TaxID=313606 RepID=A1ZLP9_MICM2|nr:hydrogen peroxide-inducible genes activator [Microscilla marina]EAY28803.1 transcriptional regulator, LysR family [Microscilla marina ATCC 23134]
MVSLIQLEYIVAVDTYRHFATAAEKCFVTQPTLSMQIKKMEEDLGVVVFDRSKQPVVPTDVGKLIIEQARNTLRESSKIQDIVQQFQNNVTGELKVGIIPTLAPYLLPLFVGSFTREYPSIQLQVYELLTEEIIDHLQKDLLDVGLLVTPLREKGMVEKPIFYEEIMVYTSKDHPILTNQQLRPKDIASEELWMLNDGHCFYNQVANLCGYQEQAQKQQTFNYRSGSLETLKKMVEVEGGFTLLPELATLDLPSGKQAQIRRFEPEKPLREVSLVYVRNFAKIKLLDLLFEHIAQNIPQDMHNKDKGKVTEWR